MIIADGMNITMSYGDTFLATFNIRGYILTATDTIKFSIKARVDSSDVLYETIITNITGTSFTIEIDKTIFMNSVGKGNKVYDLLLSYGEADPETQRKSTLNFPARLTIKDVVHNV